MKFKSTLSAGLAAIALALCWTTQPALAFVTVSVQPTNQVAFVGSNAVFTAQVGTTAGEIITGYTWQMSTNGLNPFTTIPGATGSVCTLTNLQTTDTGFYFVKVTYSSGSTNGLVSLSGNVTLTVPDQARITVQPQGGLIRPTGSNVSFSVTALGQAPLVYQWRHNGTNLSNGGSYSGASATTLSIANLALGDSGSYDVVVTNLYSAVTSQVATLSVFAPPTISVHPIDSTVILSSNASFNVTAAGSAPLTYRWRKNGANLSNGGRISGATTSALLITGTLTTDAGSYTVYVSNIVGSVTSSVATLTVLVPPTITSPTAATGKQGSLFSFTNTATGTLPITFGVQGLPLGLTYNSTNGVISGIPLVFGIYNLTIFATNAAATATGPLTLTLISDVPGITSSLAVNGKQGQTFAYTITASNNPTSFTASALPDGLNFDAAAGIIFGAPIVSGTFPIAIGVANQFGSDSQTLTITIASSVPRITSPLTASWTENLSGFTYTILASDNPVSFGASGLPLGLTLATNTGIITGTPLYGGPFNVTIWAINAWGTGSTNLLLNLDYAPINGLAITDVATNWSSPYLLDFSFSLRDGTDPATSTSVVRPPSALQMLCLESGIPLPSEAPFVLESAKKKQLRSFLVLDYTYSMFSVSGAIDAMESAAKLLINEEPVHALFGIYEFHADYIDPMLVTNIGGLTNVFISDKAGLSAAIDGIESTYVQGNYAGTRCWDAMNAALDKFDTNNLVDEQRYLVVMSDGNDDSSLLNTNADPVTFLINKAVTKQVKIFCVGFGSDVNTNALQQLTSQTGGHYYLAAETSDLTTAFQMIVKDIDGRYSLRWATLRRTAQAFQPSFFVTLSNLTAAWNTNLFYSTNIDVDTNTTPPTTNYSQGTNIVSFPYKPTDWAGNVKVGSLRLVPDADVGPQSVHLRAVYVPRFIRAIQIKYRPNFPCTPSLDSNGANDILYGWSMTETNDGTGLRTLTLLSSDPTNLLTSMPYGAFGDLVTFQFAYPESVTATQAFSVFSVDNSIYSNITPSGLSFVISNATNFVTFYNATNSPPHGTPIPWLVSYGFTNNFAAAELSDPNTNGMPVWQEYLAGLNPRDPNSRFEVRPLIVPGQPPQIFFSTVVERTYRLEMSTSLGNWAVLRDNMPGTGGWILFIDNRNLSGVHSMYYRVAAY